MVNRKTEDPPISLPSVKRRMHRNRKFWKGLINGLLLTIAAVFFMWMMLTLFMGCKTTSPNNEYLIQSYMDPRKYVIVADPRRNEDQDGFVRKSYIHPTRTDVFDDDGNYKGYWRKSYMDPRKRVYIKKK
jgi:hypothetical protein